MPTWQEYIDSLRNYDPENEENNLEEIVSGIENVFNDMTEGFKNTVASKDDLVKEKEAEISRLQSHNYELMTSGSGIIEPDDDGKEEKPVKGINSLFKFERK